jgi:hypothetical protein
MRKTTLTIFGVLMVMTITGCATIVSKTEYPVTISTNAPNAHVTVRNSMNGLILANGKAPVTVTLKTSKGFFEPATYMCDVYDEKKKKQTRVIETQFNKWFLGNFVIGGIIGMGVDGLSGACYKFDESIYIHYSEHEPYPEPEVTQEKKSEVKTEEKTEPKQEKK